jgi:thiol-disulfide isomerase/thioredoxin
LKEAALLLANQTIIESNFGLAENMYKHLHLLNERYWKGDQSLTLEEIMEPLKDTPAIPYIFARGLSISLNKLNDPAYFESQKANFDRYIHSPYLRNSILRIQQSKKNFQENPKPVSDYILYGKYQDQVKAQENLTYMQPFYDLLKKHQGKMIYIDFWGTWCPPCLAEMEPLKELRKKYSPDDIAFISICRSDDRKRYEQILDKFKMHVPGIEHIYANDLQAPDQVHKMYNQLNVVGLPHFLIINREGVIVNYGNMMRPSYPGTAECIEEWLE